MVWFEHVQQRPVYALVRRSCRIIVHRATRTGGKSKWTCMEAIKKHMGMMNLTMEKAYNRTELKKKKKKDPCS